MSNCQHNETTEQTIQKLRDENEWLKGQLTSAQRSVALGELVGTTTHEFNNLLMMILNYAKMGLRNTDQEARNKSFTKILKAGERAAKITNSVLGMARNRSEDFAPTNLENLVDETMILLEKELQKYQTSFEIDVEDNLPTVPAIGNQIQQILLNLVVNARQAMGNGGQMIIRLKQDRKANTVDLSVRDFGPGIPPEKLTKIFDAGFSTKSGPDESGKGGAGFGLHACHNIVETHGGKIRVQSTVGKGTAFTLKLPVSRAKTVVPAMNSISNAQNSATV